MRRRRSQTREEPRFRSYEDDRRGRRGHGDDDRFNQDDARERDEVYTDDPHADDRRHR